MRTLLPLLMLTAAPALAHAQIRLSSAVLGTAAMEAGHPSIRKGNGALEIGSTGGGGLSTVATNATLKGKGTSGNPLKVATPLVLKGSAVSGLLRGENDDGHFGYLGGNVGVYGENSNGNSAWLGTIGSAIFGRHHNDNRGGIGDSGAGAFGIHGATANRGSLGHPDAAVFGRTSNHIEGYIASRSVAVYGEHPIGSSGYLGGRTYAVFGDGSSSGYAGGFNGDVIVLGNLSKSGGSFKIDHPLDPANKYLSHSFVESPDMMNVYNGNVVLNAGGEAVVELPDYFEALNRDFRYQLTAIGEPGPNLYVAKKISGNRFRIAGGKPGMEVSWQVTGIRHDAWANEHRIAVEEEKPARERGSYLHPELFEQPQERSLMWAHDPELMQEIAAGDPP